MASKQDLDHTLKKKPVRKATAKTTKSETKAKSTRGKKAAPEPEPDEVEAAEEPKPKTRRGKKADPEPEVIAEIEPIKTTARRTAGRPRKAITQNTFAPDSEESEQPAKAARATKAGSVRGKKEVAVSAEAPAQEEPKTGSAKNGSVRGRQANAALEEAPALPAPEEPKPSRRTRTTATKAQPLSPKKITQVSKPTARNTRAADQKLMQKAASQGPARSGRGAAKKRTVSDENADVPEFGEAAAKDDEVVVVSSAPVKATPLKRAATRSQASTHDTAIESEASMSSRPTTPNDSPAQSLSQAEDDVDEEDLEDIASVSEAATPTKDDLDNSADELCGPKTPMRRSSPGAEARYQSSVQRTIRRYEDEMSLETPARRYAVLGSQRGTPQTQKPYCKPAMPASEVRPMTVARGSSRAFVFKDLREGAPSLPEQHESSTMEDGEMSFIPDENIIPTGKSDDEQSVITPTAAAPTEIPSLSAFLTELEEGESMNVGSTCEDDEADYIAPSAVQALPDDPDETVILNDLEDSVPSPVTKPAESFETEDTVIITHPYRTHACDTLESDDSGTEYDSVVVHDQYTSPAQRTLFSETVKHDTTIAVNFDEHLIDVRASPRMQATEQLSIAESIGSPQGNEEDAVVGADMEIDHDLDVPQEASRRETVDLNDFIDIAALAELSEQLNFTQRELPEQETELVAVDLTQTDETSMALAPELHTAVENQAAIEDQDVAMIDADTVEGAEADHDETLVESEAHQDHEVPHYALPTIAFDARRKSLPAFSHQTPVNSGTRPNTSDGASIPRLANPFANPWSARSRAGSTTATPGKARPSTAHATPSAVDFGTPAKSSPAKTPVVTPKERFPRLRPRENYEEGARTVTAPRFQVPPAKSPKRRETFHKAVPGQAATVAQSDATGTPSAGSAVAAPQTTPKERYPQLGARQDYEEHAKTVAAPARFQMPSNSPPKRRETFHKAVSGQAAKVNQTDAAVTPSAAPSAVTTPLATPNERFPRLRPRKDYQEHAKTFAAPTRFQTPNKTPVKRSATVQKPESLRKAALKANTPRTSHTPVKTPLKAPAMTPAQAPMTPHPAAPLRGVLALVEVFTLEGASASAPFVALLHRLGAKTTRAWNDHITHVIFKDGSPTTLQRVRLNNKEVDAKGAGANIHCVNSRWVTDCDTEGTRMDESDEAYALDVAEVPRGGKRRRKSMEPSALMNMGGNIVRDRKSSMGRPSSLGRSQLNFDSPAKKGEVTLEAMPDIDAVETENSPDGQASACYTCLDCGAWTNSCSRPRL